MKVSFITRDGQRKTIEFNPNEMKPFDKVLYLENYTGGDAYHWRIGFFEKYISSEQSISNKFFFYLMGDVVPMERKKIHSVVIPVEGNENLVFENIDIDYLNVVE